MKAKGHLDQEAKNLQSTKIVVTPEVHDVEPTREKNNAKTDDIMCSIFDTTEFCSKSFSDQTGKFSVTSTQGKKYSYVMYHYDTNSIHMVPIKSRHADNIMKAWNATF